MKKESSCYSMDELNALVSQELNIFNSPSEPQQNLIEFHPKTKFLIEHVNQAVAMKRRVAILVRSELSLNYLVALLKRECPCQPLVSLSKQKSKTEIALCVDKFNREEACSILIINYSMESGLL